MVFYEPGNSGEYPRVLQYNNDTDQADISVDRHTGAGVDLSVLSAGVVTCIDGRIDRVIQLDGDDRITTEIDGKKLVVHWKIGLNTTARPGVVQFILTFTDAGSLVWQSGLYYLQVDETLNPDDIPAQYPSLLAQFENLMRRLCEDAQQSADGAKEQATRAEAEADRAEIKAGEADVARNAAVEQAQAASTSKDEATKSKEETRQIKAETEQLKGQAAQAYEECKLAEQRVISLMSTDTRSYFFATLAERDEAEGMRNCDRCSVFETRADYIYDDHDIDGDGVNPEWVKTSDWDALKTVAWEIITGKPAFAAVATSGSYNDLSDKPRRYEQFITLADGNWDYAKSDKAVITLIEDTPINITNLYSGAVGLIKVYGGELILPAGSKRSVDFDYLTALPGEHYTYTFVYDGAALCWARTVCINGE